MNVASDYLRKEVYIMKKFSAFTLSEILVTLAIVGVVSVLTLPNVTASYQKKVQVASLQRTYNMITTAVANYMNDNRLDDLGYSNLTNLGGVEDFIENYLDPTLICSSDRDDISNCVENTYNSFDRSSTFSWLDDEDFVCANLSMGATICFSAYDGIANVYIDTNGRKKPNTAGRDFFGDIPLWHDGKLMGSRADFGDCPPEGESYATACFGKIQQDGWEMNY